MKATTPEIQRILETLADTPRRLTAACAGVDETRLRLNPEPSGWSAVDILAHLRACADVWGESIEAMLADEEPELADVHPRQWLQEKDYPNLTFTASLKAFTRQRKKMLGILKTLSLTQWSRGAQIGERRHTIFTQARRMAKHEMEHCAQAEAVLRQ